MARFNGALLDKINIIGFKPSNPDPYLWIRDTGNHHEYISVCYDDLLVFSKNPMGILKYIYTWFTLKVVVRHELYLGGDIKIYNYDTREFHHIKSTRIYNNNVRDKIETLFENNIINYWSPLIDGYNIELDTYQLLFGYYIYKYRMIIGLLNWSVTLGRLYVKYSSSDMGR